MVRPQKVPGFESQIAVGVFREGLSLQYYLPWIVFSNYDTVAHTLHFEVRIPSLPPPGLAFTPTLAPGETESYPARLFRSVREDNDNYSSSILYFYSTDPISSLSTTKVQGNQTLVDNQSGNYNPPGSTGTTTGFSGSVVIPVGSLVEYTIGGSGAIATAGALTYIIIQGGTTAAVYAKGVAGSYGPGSFYMSTSEKLNVVYANADSVSHHFGWSWVATSP